MFSFITKLFGTQSERETKKLDPYVKKINTIYQKLFSLSHDELRAETNKLRQYLQEQVKDIEANIATLKQQITLTSDIKEQYNLFAAIEKQEKKHALKTENALLAILPTAFAIMKETARRFSENKEIVVVATDLDRKFATEHAHVVIEEDKAHWSNTWIVGGHNFTWNMIHYDVQLMGGIVLHQGKIAEMGTGEGKTLVATLPIFLNALTQKGIHVMTINDYLAQRDAEWMGPLLAFHGIGVACIESTQIQSEERKKAYQADVTYGTNSSFAFDYLYDNIAKDPSEQVQRGFYYAIIDEIDEALIDGARTPYIISGPQEEENSHIYRTLKPRVKQMYQQQQKLVVDFLNDAREKIANNDKKQGGLSLFRAYRGLPTYVPLIRFLSEKGIKKILVETESYFLEENGKYMPEADAPLFFTIDKKNNIVDITDKGIEYLTQKNEKENFFILPDISIELEKIEKSTEEDEVKIEQKRKMIEEYKEKNGKVHAVTQLLKAYALFQKNVDYVVLDNQVKIVDHKTGRVLKSRRYSDGLHESLEAKEDVSIAKPSQTYATITPPNLVRKYHKIAGMTGTANTEATEFAEIYNLEVVTIPPNKPLIRKDLKDKIYKTEREKFKAIAAMVKELQQTNRPILIITPSVEVSERIRKLLDVPPTQVLNAKNHHLEADIIAQAGQPYAITIATQMAGRGTDIKVAEEAEKNGGLCVIITEKHETRRVINQARGRTGRQGQKGSSICFLSLEDSLIVHWQQGVLGRQVDKIWEKEGDVLQDNMIDKVITNIQKEKEHSHFLSRKRSCEYDNIMDKQRDVIYKRRNHALSHKYLSFDVMYSIYSTIRAIIHERFAEKEEHTILSLVEIGLERDEVTKIVKESTRLQAIRKLYQIARVLQIKKENEFKALLCEKLKDITEVAYAIIPIRCRENVFRLDVHIPTLLETNGKSVIAHLQSIVTLESIDKLWTSHLKQMEELEDSVRTASYENRDPLLVYKIEGVNLFKMLVNNINKNIAESLLSYEVIIEGITLQQEGLMLSLSEHLQANKENPDEEQAQKTSVHDPIVLETAINRNEKVTVRYLDGTVKENVKYKTVAEDITSGKCVVIEEIQAE